MEKTRVRRSDFALLQDHQAGGHRAADETQLHVHFRPDPDRVANENLFARQRADYGYRVVLSRAADRAHPVVAGGADFCEHLHQRDFNHHLRQ